MLKPRISVAGDGQGCPLSPPEAHLVDRMKDRYAEWRECAAAVATAYERWFDAPRGEQHQQYSAYTASLDQEQSAAMSYEHAVADVHHRLEKHSGNQ